MEASLVPKPLPLLVALLLITGQLFAANITTCMPTHEVKIYDLFPDQSAEKLSTLPKPLKISHNTSEDDGGGYKVKTYEYPAYTIEIVRDVIDSIALTSPEYKWYKGITINMDRDKVMGLLGNLLSLHERNDQVHYITCDTRANVYVILDFMNNKLTRVNLVKNRP